LAPAPRDYVLVIDSSQSMVGERFQRAARLAAELVAQLDSRDRFLLLACDVECRALPGGARPPSSQAAAEVRDFLGGLRPADASALSALARAGGGHYVPYVPGEAVSATALSVLLTTYGVSLTGVSVELPPGVTDVAPARLPNLRAGEELLLTGRFTGDAVHGE